MGLRFRKSFKAGPVRFTVSKSGVSSSIGAKGARITKTASGRTRTTLSIPGSGLSHVSEISSKKSQPKKAAVTSGVPLPVPYNGSPPPTNIFRKILNALLWIFCGFCLLFFFTFFPSAASLIFLLVALLAAPIRPLKKVLSQLHLSGAKSTLIAVALFAAAVFAAPTDSSAAENSTALPDDPASTVSQVYENERKPSELPSPAAKPDSSPTEEEPAAAPAAPQVSAPAEEVEYILNTSTMKFHKPTCSSVSKIAAHNNQGYIGTRDDVLSRGYEPCGQCHP